LAEGWLQSFVPVFQLVSKEITAFFCVSHRKKDLSDVILRDKVLGLQGMPGFFQPGQVIFKVFGGYLPNLLVSGHKFFQQHISASNALSV
jgi:hypothetical protein